MQTLFTRFRTFLVLALAATSFMAIAAAQKPPQEPPDLPNQCWRLPWQPNGSCTFCGWSCKGEGYKCCRIATE